VNALGFWGSGRSCGFCSAEEGGEPLIPLNGQDRPGHLSAQAGEANPGPGPGCGLGARSAARRVGRRPLFTSGPK
jgi:hypothetical protein